MDPTKDKDFSFFVGSNWKFVPGNIKYDETHHETFEKTSNKKVIAQKPLTNLYETNSTYISIEAFISDSCFRVYVLICSK